ncbi:hypothetical protein FSP39_016875 [Pinctada imbricata]|uniref:UspA domain-containing protein n=1 Tax=Pinctada imbricata TaxID=66713 RepID=A0AA89C084_PINIB|nr:hypothetical protein FSP39_016875 [Pinctada imbricata]
MFIFLLFVVHACTFVIIGYAEKFHRTGNKITLLHCPENFISDINVLSPGTLMDLQKERASKTASLMDKFMDKARSLHIEAEFMSKAAEKAGHAIVEVSEDMKPYMIVVGTRGMGKIRRTILGSVSDFVVHHAHCPVLVYRQK